VRAPTLKQAEAAREQHSDELARLGAHAVGVEKAGTGWVVVAYVEPATTFSAPETISAKLAGREVDVPLMVQREDMFKAE
jgi:hypothetical protein